MLRSSFSLAGCFALVLSGCCTHSTCGCESTQYETTRSVEVTEDELRAVLGANGQIGIEDCRRLCGDQYGETVVSCAPEETPPGAQRVLGCRVLATAYCEGRRHAINRGRSSGTGPCDSTAWLARAAHAEAASVPAFLALRRELGRLGAPQPLLDRALRAAAEEVTHARLLGALVRRRGGRCLPLNYARSVPRRTTARLARENAVEGCVHETFAALMAKRQAVHSGDPEVRIAFARIATDELAHAELAWDIQRFLETKLDARNRGKVRVAVRAASERLIAAVGKPALSSNARSDLGLPEASEAVRMSRALAATLWTARPASSAVQKRARVT